MCSLQSLFREADIHNAVLFFDECESLFAQRSRGGSHQLTELLTEIERHKGIIFLATNRPYDLDEAMCGNLDIMFDHFACVFPAPQLRITPRRARCSTSYPY